MDELKYPVGKYVPQDFSAAELEERLYQIEILPQALEFAVQNLDAAQLEIPYREGGWNSRQVVHHVADSHMNAYMRFKLGLTEELPHIKPYDENAWSELADVKEIPINVSLTLLHAVHRRLVSVLRSLKTADWERKIFHPAHQQEMTHWYVLGNYAWHGKHHTAHINSLRERMGWR